MEKNPEHFPQYGKPLASGLLGIALLAGGAGCASVKANRLAVPPEDTWTATASASVEGQGPERALDGQTNTAWRSGAEEPQWIAVELRRPAMVCGFSLEWGEPPAQAYAVETSVDGETWALGHETEESDGGWDEVLIEPILARHVRVTVKRGLQGNGAALRRLDILGLAERPQVRVDGALPANALALLDRDAETVWRSSRPEAVMDLDLREEWRIGSLRVDWGAPGPASNVIVELSADGTNWVSAGRIRTRSAEFEVLLLDDVQPARHLRLTLSGAASPEGFGVAGLTLTGPEGRLRPWSRLQVAAEHAPEGVYPDVFRRRQNYWALAGGGARGEAESLLDEWGVFAPYAGGPTLAPLIQSGGELLSARQAADLEHRLAGDGAPMPETVWRMPSGLTLRIRAMGSVGANPPVSWTSYELVNDSIMAQTGRLCWVVRPVQLPPPWAGGGLAPIYHARAMLNDDGWQELWLNGVRVFAVPGDELPFGAAPFQEGDVTEVFRQGQTPTAQTVRDIEGLASAAWWRDFELEPGERVRAVVAADAQPGRGRRFPLPASLANGRRLADAFEREWIDALWRWRERATHLDPDIARPDAIECLHAQVGWLLAGHGLRDGGEDLDTVAWRVAALLRAGLPDAARPWVEMVAAGIETNGRVPARFQADGRPAGGRAEPQGRHAAQGQLAFLVMEQFRFTQDTAFLQQQYPAMRAAMEYARRLRRDQARADSRLPLEERELVEGLLPPSGGRPGHPRPARFYADQYWTLLGWKELRTAASRLGRDEDAARADAEYRDFKAAVKRTLRADLDRRSTFWVPATPGGEEFDALSAALLFWPCGERDLVEPHELQASLDRFYADFLRRAESPAAKMPSNDSILLGPLSAMGRGDYAREVLYGLLARRQPAGWHTWADAAVADIRKPGLTGFMPDLTAAAAYVTGVRGLAARETGTRLDLFCGAPAEWLQHGTGFKVFGMPTQFGPLDLRGDWEGTRFTVEIGGAARPPGGYRIWWPRQVEPVRVLANGTHWKEFDSVGATLPHDFQGTVEAEFPTRAPWPRDP